MASTSSLPIQIHAPILLRTPLLRPAWPGAQRRNRSSRSLLKQIASALFFPACRRCSHRTHDPTEPIKDWPASPESIRQRARMFTSGPLAIAHARPRRTRATMRGESVRTHKAPHGAALRGEDAQHIAARQQRRHIQGVLQATAQACSTGGVHYFEPALKGSQPCELKLPGGGIGVGLQGREGIQFREAQRAAAVNVPGSSAARAIANSIDASLVFLEIKDTLNGRDPRQLAPCRPIE